MSLGDTFPYSNLVNGQTAWGPQLVLILAELITRCSSPVPMSALEGADFDMDNNSILNIKSVEFYEQSAAPTTDPGGMYYLSGEWYLVTNDGAIQITSGGVLNVATTGGIGGDYGAGPEEARFVNGSQRYDFWDDFGAGNYGYVRARGFDVNNGAAGANYCRLIYATAANLTLTLPPAIPAAGRSVLVVDDTGEITFNNGTNTIENDIVLTGTAKVQHGDYIRTIDLASSVCDFGTHGTLGSFISGGGQEFSIQTGAIVPKAALTIKCGFGMGVGERVKQVKIYYDQDLAGNHSASVYLCAWGAEVLIGAAVVVNSVTDTGTITVPISEPGYPAATIAGVRYKIVLGAPAANSCKFFSADITYDVPA